MDFALPLALGLMGMLASIAGALTSRSVIAQHDDEDDDEDLYELSHDSAEAEQDVEDPDDWEWIPDRAANPIAEPSAHGHDVHLGIARASLRISLASLVISTLIGAAGLWLAWKQLG